MMLMAAAGRGDGRDRVGMISSAAAAVRKKRDNTQPLPERGVTGQRRYKSC